MPRPKRAELPDSPAKDDRSIAARLIEAAETLYGLHGLNGVSLRQIGSVAATSNNYAVQYHFGDAAGIIKAILASRMPAVDRRQAAMLAAADAAGVQLDTRLLLEILLRPLLEQVNSAGERSYARFITALLNAAEGVQYCRDLFNLTPSAGIVVRLLRQANPGIPFALLQERLRLSSMMVCTSVFNRLIAATDSAADAALIDDAFATAAAGLMQQARQAVLFFKKELLASP